MVVWMRGGFASCSRVEREIQKTTAGNRRGPLHPCQMPNNHHASAAHPTEPTPRTHRIAGERAASQSMPASASSAADLLLGSFVLQIAWTTLLGWIMLLPHQPWAKDLALARMLRSKDVTAAHVDWIVLALVQVGAAIVIPRCEARLSNPHVVAWCIICSGWYAPTVYFLKAFGINGFRATGKPNVESLVGLMGVSGTMAFTFAWAQIVRAWFGW